MSSSAIFYTFTAILDTFNFSGAAGGAVGATSGHPVLYPNVPCLSPILGSPNKPSTVTTAAQPISTALIQVLASLLQRGYWVLAKQYLTIRGTLPPVSEFKSQNNLHKNSSKSNHNPTLQYVDEGGRAQTVPDNLSEHQQQLGRQNVVLNYGGIPHPAFER